MRLPKILVVGLVHTRGERQAQISYQDYHMSCFSSWARPFFRTRITACYAHCRVGVGVGCARGERLRPPVCWAGLQVHHDRVPARKRTMRTACSCRAHAACAPLAHRICSRYLDRAGGLLHSAAATLALAGHTMQRAEK